MEKVKTFFKKLLESIKGLYTEAKELFVNDRRRFCLIATKASFAFLFWFAILLPVFGLVNNVNVFDLPIGWLWFIIFLVLPFAFAILALKGKKLANTIFKIGTIIGIVLVAFELLSYILVAADSSLTTPNIKIGFFLAVIFIVVLSLLLWRESLVMNFVYKVFKVPELQEVEYVEVSEPAPKPEPVEEPEPVEKPEPVEEPEPEKKD